MQKENIKKGWKKVILKNITLNITDGTHSTVKDNNDGTYYLLSCKNIKEGNILINEKDRKIDEITFYNLNKRTKLQKNDILITTVGTIGETAIIKTNDINFELQRSVAIIKPDSNFVNPNFLYFCFNGLELRNQIIGLSRGVAQQCLFLDPIRNIQITIPESLQTQQKIASILSKYDDLIENNNKRIKILEDMAQTIYKEWFIDFRFPGFENVKMVDSGTEFGEIPEGWKVKKVEDYVDFIRGVEPGSKNYKSENYEGTIIFNRVGDLGSRNSGIFIEEELAKGKIAIEDDVLVSFDGSVGIVKRGIKGSYSTGIRKLIGKKDYISKEFLYLLFLSENIQNKIKEHAKGTTILHAGESIKYMEFVKGPENIYINFNQIIKPILDEIILINKQNQNLKQTRDILIPKLVNGELDMEDLDFKI